MLIFFCTLQSLSRESTLILTRFFKECWFFLTKLQTSQLKIVTCITVVRKCFLSFFGHSVNRKTVSLSTFFWFSVLRLVLVFALSGIRFISFYSFSYLPQQSLSSLHTAPFHFAAALPLHSSSHNTLYRCQYFSFRIVCASSRWVLRWTLVRIFRSHPISYLKFYRYEGTISAQERRNVERIPKNFTKIDFTHTSI